LGEFGILEKFSHHLVGARVLKGWFVIIFDEIEEGAEVGITGVFGELLISFRQLGEEREDFVRG